MISLPASFKVDDHLAFLLPNVVDVVERKRPLKILDLYSLKAILLGNDILKS